MNYLIVIIIVVIILLCLYICVCFRQKESFNVILNNKDIMQYPKKYNLKHFFEFMDYFVVNYNDINSIYHIDNTDDTKKDILTNINYIMAFLNFIIYNKEHNFYNRILENSNAESYYMNTYDKINDKYQKNYNHSKNNLLVYDYNKKINIMVNLHALKDIIEIRNTGDINMFNDIYDQTEIEIFDNYFWKPIKYMINSMILIGNTQIYVKYMTKLNDL